MAQKPKGEGLPGIEAETKTKVVIPDWAGRILILTRSPRESTRPGKPDLPGGSMDTADAARDGRGRARGDKFDLVRTINREAHGWKRCRGLSLATYVSSTRGPSRR